MPIACRNRRGSHKQKETSLDLLEKCDLQQKIYQVMAVCNLEIRKESSVHVTYLNCSVFLSHNERFIEEVQDLPTTLIITCQPTSQTRLRPNRKRHFLHHFLLGLISRKKANQYFPAIFWHQSQPMQQQPTLKELT